MEFSGAVLVQNDKIKNACDNYLIRYREVNQLVEECEDKATLGWKQLSKWNKFWYKGDTNSTTCWYLHSQGHKRWWKEEGFVDIGWLSKEDYDFFYCSYYPQYSTHDIYKELSQMIQAGETVYISSLQAAFVNTFYKETGDD